MKHHLRVVLSVFAWMFLSLGPAKAQAPSALAGNSFFNRVSSGVPPFAGSGYYLFIFANAGNTYQSIEIYNVLGGSGTYGYTTTGSKTATINMNDVSHGMGIFSADFATLNIGSFSSSAPSYPGAYQSGSFNFATGNAPNSIVGKQIVCTISDGKAPLLSSGTFTFNASSSGNNYTTSGGGFGTYSYTMLNRSTALIQVNDVFMGSASFYIGFADSFSHGYYALKYEASSSFQMGSVEVVGNNAVAPTITLIRSANSITLGWPTIGFKLQSSPVIPATSWQDVPGSEITTSVSIPIGSGKQFYRLK